MRRKKKKEKISFLISRKKNVWLKSDLKHSLFKGSYKDDLLTLLRELDVKKKEKKIWYSLANSIWDQSWTFSSSSAQNGFTLFYHSGKGFNSEWVGINMLIKRQITQSKRSFCSVKEDISHRSLLQSGTESLQRRSVKMKW